jgi:glycosyltransferase involved in cell wall biosynthesis
LRIVFYSPLDPSFVGGVRTWIVDFWNRYLDTRDATLHIVHSATRPSRSLDSYIALPDHPRISIECVPGFAVPGSGGRLPPAHALARALANADVCYFDNGYAFQDAVLLRAARNRVPIVSGHHAVIKFGGLHDAVWELIGKHLIRRFDAIHALNDADARYLRSLGGRNVHRIPISIDLKMFSPRSRESRFTVLFVGRLHVQKGIDRLERVIRLANERYGDSMRFVLVGSGPLIADARRLAVSPNVTLSDSTDRQTIAGLMGRAHVLIVPSRWETFGIVAAEALAAGTPIVTTGVGATREMAGADRGCVVADADDPGAWCAALGTIFDRYRREDSYGDRVTVAARTYAEQNFSFDHVAASFDALLESATCGRD